MPSSVADAVWASKHVIISGLTAAGKTTHSHLLAGEFGLRYVSASQILLSSHGMSGFQARDFWTDNKAMALWSEGSAGVDQSLLSLEGSSESAVFDCLSLPWLSSRPSLKIWLECLLAARVERAALSHGLPIGSDRGMLANLIDRKDTALCDQLSRDYGISPHADPSIFDLILDVTEATSTSGRQSALPSIRRVHRLIASTYEAWSCRDREAIKRYTDIITNPGFSVRVLKAPTFSEDPGRLHG